MPESSSTPTASVASSLRLFGGFEQSEQSGVVAKLAGLDNRLKSFPVEAVEMKVTVKERDTPSQRLTLEAWIAGEPRLVATSSEGGLDQAIVEVRDDMIRQITDAKNRSEPRNNRERRDTRP